MVFTFERKLYLKIRQNNSDKRSSTFSDLISSRRLVNKLFTQVSDFRLQCRHMYLTG